MVVPRWNKRVLVFSSMFPYEQVHNRVKQSLIVTMSATCHRVNYTRREITLKNRHRPFVPVAESVMIKIFITTNAIYQ